MTATIVAPGTQPIDDPQGPVSADRMMRPRRRFRPADLAIVAATVGLAGLLPLGAPLKALLVITFVLLGPGAALATWVRIPRPARAAAIPTLGMATATISSITAMWSYRWDTTAILVLLCLASAGSSAVWYVRTGAWPDVRHWPTAAAHTGRAVITAPGLNPPTVIVAIALIVWAVALPTLPGTDASFYSLLASGSGRLLIPAILLSAIAFVWAIATRRLAAAVLAIGAAIVVARVTTWLGTEVPLYDWTYKHIGVVRYIVTYDLIQPNGTDIYAQWPAFFVTSAWFSEVTGLDPMTMAHVFAPFVHLVLAVIVYSAARVLGQGRRVALVAVFFAEVTNWVGQDYFSPQAWTLLLAFGLLTLLLASRGAPQTAVLAIIPFAATVPTHQLTPFWLLGAATLLVFFRRIRPWWAVAAMIAIAGVYLVLNFDAVAPYGILSGGNPVENATSNITAAGVPAKEFTSLICRGLSAGVFATAALAAIWAWRTGRRHVLTRVILAFSALCLLLGQSYGGEAIFRVYLYSLLGCSLLIAPAVVALLDGWRRGVLRSLGAAVATAGMCMASLAGLYSFVALWPLVSETRTQIDVMNSLVASSEPGTRIMMMTPGGMPSRTTADYAAFTLANPYFDYPLSYDLAERRFSFPTAEQLGFLDWRADQQDHPTIVAFSTQSERSIEYYGEYAPGSVDLFKQALSESPEWTLLYQNGDNAIFRHDAGTRPR
ncbi:hypothetical protein QSJ19_08165 [Gordonia sp. ABSL11-1]|uniref:hypothetical protein n=1 Tax=Gordonia sp. ABSL11-1 TaxID=3053924 RepID=UPI002573BA83|nr:hypothetical protein [Gordonia sp. ABSL11-1]MDL9945568.1 hypothetical protein [Gordonia sp. ABSL11-1]